MQIVSIFVFTYLIVIFCLSRVCDPNMETFIDFLMTTLLIIDLEKNSSVSPRFPIHFGELLIIRLEIFDFTFFIRVKRTWSNDDIHQIKTIHQIFLSIRSILKLK